MRRRRLALVGIVMIGSTRSVYADGVFDTLAQAIEGAGRTWAPALLVLGALIVGGKIAMGSQHSGESVRNYLLGAIFLVLAAAGGAAIISKLGGFGIN